MAPLTALSVFAVHMELASSGIAVFGMDAHGHGRSEPREEDDRALVHDFRHLVRLLAACWHPGLTHLL